MSEIIIKVEKLSGEILWKTDSFWSLTENREYAKIHKYPIEEHLLRNLLFHINNMLNDPNPIWVKETIEEYNNCKIGYDFIKAKNLVEFEFLENGNYEYKIKYFKEENTFKLIDIRRKLKLEQINKRMEEIK